MPMYQVHITRVVSTTIDVEADSIEQAVEEFHHAPDMLGGLVHGAFGGGASVDEAGEWEAYSVMHNGQELWCVDQDAEGVTCSCG